MQVKYQYYILFYFLLALSVLALAFLFFLVGKERDYSIKAINSSLILYNDIAYKSIRNNNIPYDSVPIPKAVRVTLIDLDGNVIFDNTNDRITENHMTREEMAEAEEKGIGTAVRFSTTNHREYVYFVKKYPQYYIRTALEYNADILPQIENNNKYLYVIIILFIILLAIIAYFTRKLSAPIDSLSKFADIINGPDKDYSKIQFSGDKFGMVGKKILDTFDQLEKTKLYKQQMSHNIAHELKTPVTGLSAYLETILHDRTMSKEQILSFLEKAYAQTMRLSSLINDVSTLNKLDEGSKTFTNEVFSISACIKDVLEEIGYKLEANNIKLDMLISSDLKIKGCYSLVYSLFKNLIDNTVEHGGANCRITISAGVEQISGEGGYKVNFSYADTGKSVPEEAIPRLFERFYRIEKGRTRKTGGTGLGLAIVKNAVLYHKGEISAGNNPGGGLIFKFTLYSL